jgi:serine/threonine protein phosphatase PrpC
MDDAVAAAQAAAAAVPFDETDGSGLGPGACTFVAAVLRDGTATFGSVGDSRAYWVDADGAQQIGRDDSLAADLVASGRVTPEQALNTRAGHAITKWLGLDAVDSTPTITQLDLPGPGLVLVVSDGLWNYTPADADLHTLVGPLGSETPLELARRMTAFAEDAGGADNITVAVGPHGLDGEVGA